MSFKKHVHYYEYLFIFIYFLVFVFIFTCPFFILKESDGLNDFEINELSNKPEYSLLEVYQSIYENTENSIPYKIIKNAHNSSLTVIALPIKNSEYGYVMMIAESEIPPKSKYMPKVDFLITKEVLNKIKKETNLSSELELILRRNIVD